MKQQTLVALSALMFSSSVFANGGFEPNKKECVNVGKEITRVSSEMDTAKSGIQKSWLKRQLGALKTKRTSCSMNGFEANKPELAKL
ncbi:MULTISPECIES: hypothetical protein [Alteromonas]|jgi:hypothetical protein|uniref:hypothetical protein n=1 Tax=Alteromonas TaxID=226 RepID=UPI000355814F|nr:MULTISPECIES: hypothetical protein [Alteromonas]AGP80353.1 hypothetical protein I533_01790 [Alteromonas mediterranea MED64]NQY18983.1 hypothetical protein [Alteromonas sp.]|tara:strand:- start:1030 stop:1290 length:261 start_codon:yes stop_codon:yes gene_type:complete